jgi:dihydrodipicolinate synthase/N-acetylneuraminate lyase
VTGKARRTAPRVWQGNGPLMNVEEKKWVIEVVAKTIPPLIQLAVHVGATNVRDAVELARYAEAAGAAKVSSVAIARRAGCLEGVRDTR